MLNTFDTQVYELNKLLREDKLVVFIGAGVSRNSDYPSWKELAEKYASFYTKKPFSYTQQTYLEIFENAYINNKKQFETEIGRCFGKCLSDCISSNSIVDIILQLNPKHIITTNYDYLIEKGIKDSFSIYNKVVKDEDLINKSASSQFIKMHGDYENLDFLVLSETQYLNFSSTHPLIETYIKSLLIDHTFLFIGYSYQDMNFKLIMQWIKQRIKNKNKSELIKHYFLYSNNTRMESFKIKYLLKNNIEVIQYYSLKKSKNFNEIQVPKDIHQLLGKNLYTILYYIKSNMSTVDGIKYLTDKYEEVNSFFPEDFINYLGLEKFVLISNSLIRVKKIEYSNSNFDWVNKLFKNLESCMKTTKIINSKLEKLKRLFYKCGILGGIYYENGKEINFSFFNAIVPQDEITKNLNQMNYEELSSIRVNLLSSSLNSTNDLMQLIYINKIFNITNAEYVEKLCRIRNALFDEKKYLMMYIVSLNIDSINVPGINNKIPTCQIIKNIPQYIKKKYATSFAIIDNPTKHNNIMMEGFMDSVMSSYTFYGIGYDPQIKAETRFVNYINFHTKNFMIYSYSDHLKKIIEIYISTLFSNVNLYEENVKNSPPNSFVFFGLHIRRPEVPLNYILICSRYLSLNKIKKLLKKYNISKISVIDNDNQIISLTNNIINSLAKFPDNKLIRQQFLSYIFLFSNFDYNHKSINTLSINIWVIIENELKKTEYDSFTLLEILYNFVVLTSIDFDNILFLQKIFHLFLNNKKVERNQIFLVECISKKCSINDVKANENFNKILGDLIDLYFSKQDNNLLAILLLQIDFIPSIYICKLKTNIRVNYSDKISGIPVMNIYLILLNKILSADLFEEHLKKIYMQSKQMVNNCFDNSSDVDNYFIKKMISEKLINDFDK